MRCRAAWQAVVGANVTRISLTDFPMAARAVDCTESEIEKILSSRSTCKLLSQNHTTRKCILDCIYITNNSDTGTELMREGNKDPSLKFEEFVALTTMSRLRSSMYRAKLADPWFYRRASRRPFRVGDRVEVVDSRSSDFGAIGKIVNVGRRKLAKGKETLNIVVDLGDDMIPSFEPHSLNIVDHTIGPIGVLDEERRREITQKWAGNMSRRLEIHGEHSEVKNDARRHAKVLCQRKSFEKSMYVVVVS